MKKYDSLYNYLLQRKGQGVTLSFEKVETIINAKLPKSAYIYPQWWSNSNTKAHPHCRAWIDAGFKTREVQANIRKQIVTFE
jgi:hypothetical protein